MSQSTEDLRLEIRKTMDRLISLRDEARVKINLAGKDVRDSWDRLEPTLKDAEHAAEQATKDTLKTIQHAAKKLEELIASM